jgi:putrescine transport system permease protein
MRGLALLPVRLWLLAFVAAPSAVLAAMALARLREGVPPFALALDGTALRGLADPFYLAGLLGSLGMAASAALACLALGYPMALAVARTPPPRRGALLLLIMLPFWSGMLLRLTAWIGILRDEGWLNGALLAMGAIARPLPLLHSQGAMLVGLVYCYLPFMVLPIAARLEGADVRLERAAADLGAAPWRVFRHVTFPLSLPGVWVGLALVFIPVSGEYVIPELLGPSGFPTLGRMVWDVFFRDGDWPQAAALALALLGLLLAPVLALRGRGRVDIG